MKKLTYLFFCLIVGIGWISAQTIRVTGVVSSADDREPLPGVTVVEKGNAQNGTITDTDGKYAINVPSNAVLQFSFIGMASKEVTVAGKQVIDIDLHEDTQMLDEVIVVAYGTVKKSSFTGSAETVSAKTLEKRTVSNVSKALDGNVAGMKTTSGGGQPGDGSSIVIRGFGSINASNNPLYVVDGIPYDGALNAINSMDIEQITVLKDAAAASLYGNRAANGVILVTTKKGVAGVPNINFRASWGISSRALPRYNTVNEREYMELAFQAHKNNLIYAEGANPDVAGTLALARMTGASGIGGEVYNPFNYKMADLIDPVTGKVRSDATLKYSEDWVDEMLADKPLRQEYLFSYSGGTGKTNYLASLGYLDEQGLLVTTSFNRFSGRLNIESQMKDWLKSGLNASFSQTKSNFKNYGNTSSTGNVWYSSQFVAPIYPVYKYDENGNPLFDDNGKKQYDYGLTRPIQTNWNALATLHDDLTRSTRDNFSGRTYIQLGGKDMNNALKDFTLVSNFGLDYYNNDLLEYYNPYNGNAVSSNGRGTKTIGRMMSYTFNQLLTFDKEIARHHNLNILAGHEFYAYKYNELKAQKTGYAFGGLYELNAASTIAEAGSYEDNYNIESYFSRLNYNYDEKYYFSASIRTDGSSRFYTDNRWGQFWSVGASWRISSESFMDALDFVKNLTIKASYGTQGNDMLSSLYPWQALYNLEYSNANLPGGVITGIENKDLSWEKGDNLNIGIEGKLFYNNRLGFILEYYKRRTHDLLLQRPMPLSSGFSSYWDNVGEMLNQGFEATINGTVIDQGDFQWNAQLILATLKNKVVKLTAETDEIVSSVTIIKEGYPVYSFYVAKSAGVDPLTGRPLYWVVNEKDPMDNLKDPYITDDYSKVPANRQITGSVFPDYEGSFSSEFTYKGFDLSFLTTFSVGGKILDQNYANLIGTTSVLYNGNTFHKDALRAWKQPGDVSDIPKIWYNTTTQMTDRNLINRSYFAIKNIAFGYTIPKNLIRKAGIEALRVYAQGDNLALFTHMKGLDPQFNFSGNTSNYLYITNKMVSFGIEVKF